MNGGLLGYLNWRGGKVVMPIGAVIDHVSLNRYDQELQLSCSHYNTPPSLPDAVVVREVEAVTWRRASFKSCGCC